MTLWQLALVLISTLCFLLATLGVPTVGSVPTLPLGLVFLAISTIRLPITT